MVFGPRGFASPSVPDRVFSGGASNSLVSRRELLASLGGAAAVSRGRSGVDDETVDADGPLSVRLYPTPVALWARLRDGVAGIRKGWPPPFRAALAAVEDALEQVLAYAHERSRLTGLEAAVERGGPVRFSLAEAPPSSEALVPELETVLERFHDRLREREVLTGSTCHLLLCWSPFNYRVGYGGTLSPNARIGDDGGGTDGDSTGGDALTVANIGATEFWDSRAVTRNIAIHEVLHTYLEGDIVEPVVGSRCDHDLGAAERISDETMSVSPMATAYAGPDEVGGGTRFHGTGCYDHDDFHRHDGHEGVENWTYTTELSEATLEAVTRYLERTGVS